MADHETTRQRFEDRCWQHYMAKRQRRDLPGDVVDEFPTREQLFWRQPGGAYGVLMFNAAWQAWCWALEDLQPVAQQPNDDIWGSCNAHFGQLKHTMQADDHCLRCVTPKKCAIFGCCPGTWPSEVTHGN